MLKALPDKTIFTSGRIAMSHPTLELLIATLSKSPHCLFHDRITEYLFESLSLRFGAEYSPNSDMACECPPTRTPGEVRHMCAAVLS